MKKFDVKQAIKVIINPARLEIIKYLLEGPSCATKALAKVNLSQPNLSQHLHRLKDAGIVDCKIRGNERCYFICRQSFVQDIMKTLSDEHEYIACEKPEQGISK
ncbi:MAG: metalloregulator ArsR/SmtB family transcription factor [Kiritimatiellae bacterium]|nr:metalloregulator ArsR/SmtB family transcription factor [Kiritimatiellia bacterium]